MGRKRPDAVEVTAVALLVVVLAFGFYKITRPDGRGLTGAAPPEGPAGNPVAYRFLSHDPTTGEPVRFNPCEPLRYVVNSTGVADSVLPIVHEAVKEVTAAAGLETVFEGTTDEAPPPVDGTFAREPYQPSRYGAERWAPVLIASQDLPDPGDGRRRGGRGTAIGVKNPAGRPLLVTGTVVLDPELPRRSMKLAVMHELGHVLGLDHVDDRHQIMFTGHDYVSANPKLGAGDLAGLRLVGREAGCLEPAAPSRDLRLLEPGTAS